MISKISFALVHSDRLKEWNRKYDLLSAAVIICQEVPCLSKKPKYQENAFTLVLVIPLEGLETVSEVHGVVSVVIR